jgi:hypothetical protein
MLNMRKTLQWVLVAAAASFAPAAMADSITFTLSDPNQTAVVGETLDFYATVTAPNSNAATEYLNADAPYVDSLTLDDTGFWDNFVSVDPGGSITNLLFAVTVPNETTPGLYTGTFTLFGGEDGGNYTAYDNLGTVDFQVQVTPEPSVPVLMLTGLLGLSWLMRKRLAL